MAAWKRRLEKWVREPQHLRQDSMEVIQPCGRERGFREEEGIPQRQSMLETKIEKERHALLKSSEK